MTPILTLEQKLTYREMQIEQLQLQIQLQSLQVKLQLVTKRMNDFIVGLASTEGVSTNGLSFDPNTLTFLKKRIEDEGSF